MKKYPSLAAAKSKKGIWSYLKQEYLLYIMISVGVAYIVIFKYIPMGGVLMSFQDYKLTEGLTGSEWIGLDNFRNLFSRSAFRRALGNNLIISLQKLLFGFPTPILLSLLINEVRNARWKKFIQTSVILPNFVSWIVVYGLMTAILAPSNGAIKEIATLFGYTGELNNVLTDTASFRMVILFSYIWKEAGIGTIVYLAAISGIDPTLYEAAAIDGVGRLRRMWHITLASIRPTIVVLLIFRVGAVMDAGFDQIYAISNDFVISVADIIDTYVYRMGLAQRRYGIAAAAGLFKSLIGFALVLTTNYIAKKIDPESGIM